MNCFPCFSSNKSKNNNSFKREHGPIQQENVITRAPVDIKKPKPEDPNQVDTSNIQAQNFTFRELATATKNFRQECLMGEGGFGRVYKGTIPATGQVIAVKQLDRNGMQGGSKEFLVEVLMLSLLHHENLVKLVGYCADGDQRLLVYEFLPGASLEHRLLERRPDEAPLDWYSRMKIASSSAKGLWYLHDRANPPVIYRDLKSSNILLDNDFNAKLSDYGLAKLAGKDKMNIVPTRVMGTYGYSAPEYVRTGNLTLKSDVYSFGVVLLELITGRRAVDTTRPNDEQNLVSWAQPIFRDPKRYGDMADPLLKKNYPEKDLNQVVAIAAMCLQEEPGARPLMSDVVTALSYLSTSPPEGVHAPPLPSLQSKSESEAESGKDSHSSESEEECSYHKDNNKTAKKQVSANAKHRQESDVSDPEVDYYQNENQHDYSPQDTKEFYSKSSRKSSTKSRNGTNSSGCRSSISSESSDSEDDNLSMSSSHKSSRKKSHGVNLSQKSSTKSSLSQKSSKKSSLSQKSSKKSSLSQKSSKKSVRVLSNKTSTNMGSEDGSLSYHHGNVSNINHNSSSSSEESHDDGDAVFDRSGSRPSQGNTSSGLFSIQSVQYSEDHYSSRRSEEGSSIHILDHTSSSGSDEESDHSPHKL